VSKPEFGRKLTCTGCAVRFYDLSRSPAICPKCGAEQPAVMARVIATGRGGGLRWSSRGGNLHVVAPTPVEPASIETDALDGVDEADEVVDDDDEEETVIVEAEE
jgi:uncharacterized protein (TIGR02300 family)